MFLNYSIIGFFFGIMSVMFLCSTVLMFLISMEFLVISVMGVLLQGLISSGLLEIMFFMVVIVSESVLGLVMMLILVKVSGSDLLMFNDVI